MMSGVQGVYLYLNKLICGVCLIFCIVIGNPSGAQASSIDGSIYTYGVVTDKTDSFIVIGSVQYSLESNTIFEKEDGEQGSFVEFAVGDEVEAQGTIKDGILYADSLAMKKRVRSVFEIEYNGVVESIAAGSISVMGRTFYLTSDLAVDSVHTGDQVSLKVASAALDRVVSIQVIG